MAAIAENSIREIMELLQVSENEISQIDKKLHEFTNLLD